jgi:RNA polymerase primary sigma factor
MMDLIQEGNIGLMTAASKFQASFKTRFSTYAYTWIMQYMLRYINNHCALITLPHRKDEMIRRVEAAQAYLFQQTGHEATSTELALYLGVQEEEMSRIMTYSYAISSLDANCNDDSMMTVGDLLADTTFSPETIIMTEEKKRLIRSLMMNLPENEQKVIWYRFNFDNEVHVKTLREISDVLGVSAETVRQTELRALRHMRAEMTAKEEVMIA